MADAPGWHYELSDAARWVVASGLATSLEPPPVPLDDQAWVTLVDAASRHELGGLLVRAIVAGTMPVTESQRAEAGELELALTRRRIEHERRSAPVLAVLDAAGVETRLIKGAALARLVYPDVQLRPTSDLDVLVRAGQIDAASAALVAAGGERVDPDPTPGWASTVGTGATVYLPWAHIEADLHRLLRWGPIGVRIPADELWERSLPVRLAGVDRAAMGLEENLLQTVEHLLIVGFPRAREVRDVAQIASHPDFDTDRMLWLAARWGQEAMLATAVVFAGEELRLERGWCGLAEWAAAYRVGRLDAVWLRTGAGVGRLHGVMQLGVFWELGKVPGSWRARKVLVRANLFPVPGTYPSPFARVGAVVDRAVEPVWTRLTGRGSRGRDR